jgi:hypothetical protein
MIHENNQVLGFGYGLPLGVDISHGDIHQLREFFVFSTHDWCCIVLDWLHPDITGKIMNYRGTTKGC